MPFETNFEAAEFAAAIDANPQILEKVIPALSTKGYAIRSKDEDTQFRTTLAQQERAAERAAATKEYASSLERDVEELTGIKKVDPNEKYYDYNKRALKSLNEELQQLRGKSDLSAVERQQLSEYKAKLDQLNNEKQSLEGKYTSELTKAKIENGILLEVAPIRASFKKDIPVIAINAVHAQVMADMAANAKQEGGKTLFLNPDGTIALNKTTLQPMTAAEVYTDKMKDFIGTTHKQSGAGGNEPEFSEDGLPSTVKTKVDLTEYLSKQGISSTDKKYQELWDKWAPKLPLR